MSHSLAPAKTSSGTSKFWPLCKVDRHRPANQWRLIQNRLNKSFLFIYGSMGILRSPSTDLLRNFSHPCTVYTYSIGLHSMGTAHTQFTVCTYCVGTELRNVHVQSYYILCTLPTKTIRTVVRTVRGSRKDFRVFLCDFYRFGNRCYVSILQNWCHDYITIAPWRNYDIHSEEQILLGKFW
jgi:hypothetical protein